MEIKVVEAFALIMRVGSITRAQSETGIPKSTLSRLVRNLEEDLGVQLLVRSSRKLVPTEAGRVLYGHCETLLSQVRGRWEAARQEVQDIGSASKGRLCVLTDNHFATTFLCHVTRVFLSKYPDVLCELDAAGRADSPRMEDVDCYVCAEPPDLPDVIAKVVGRLTYGLFASPAYLLRHGHPYTPADLSRHTSIGLRKSEFGEATILYSDQTSHPYSCSSAIMTNDYWVMKTSCVDGLGIALLPDFFVQPELNEGSLAPVLPAWKPMRKRIFCAYHRHRFVTKKLQGFIDLLTDSMQEIDSVNMHTAMVPSSRDVI